MIVALGGMNLFGAVGSMGFSASMATGGVLVCGALSGLIWVAIVNCKRQNRIIPTKDSREIGKIYEPTDSLGKAQSPYVESHNIGATYPENPPDGLMPSCNLGSSERSEASPEAGEAELLKFCEKVQKGTDISEALSQIPKSFFKNKSQERSKVTFSKVMKSLQNATVEFPKAGPLDSPENLKGVLDEGVFQLSVRLGVQKDIPNSSHDTQHVHVYQVASQYNAAEAPGVFTPAIGQAMQTSISDGTQGPLAQRTNPTSFELVTAFLTHLGFNMLHEVLPSAGSTYEKGTPIEHGYLLPNNSNITSLIKEFKDRFANAEYVCYSSFPSAWKGSQPVYIFLQAAPAIGYATITSSSDELQKYAALANYLAFFRYGIKLAKETSQPVVLHVATVGGGAFENEAKNLKWGLEKAGLALQEEMKSNKVFVQLEADSNRGMAREIGLALGMAYKPRVGK